MYYLSNTQTIEVLEMGETVNFWDLGTGAESTKNLAKKGNKTKYPFTTMEVGQSYFIEGDNSSSNSAVAAYNCGRRTGKKFRCTTVEDGLVVTRVE